MANETKKEGGKNGVAREASSPEIKKSSPGKEASSPEIKKSSSAPFDVSSVLFFDIDTQKDFMEENGANPVKDAAEILEPIRKLIRFTREYDGAVVSLKIIFPAAHNFGRQTPHCVAGTPGCGKIEASLFPKIKRVRWGEPGAKIAAGIQVIFERVMLNPWQMPGWKELIASTQARTAIVFGVSTTSTLRDLVVGLRDQEFSVLIVSDAVAPRRGKNVDTALNDMLDSGAEVVNLDSLLSGSVQVI
jgi:nicotinamidase-related amidase